MKLIAPYYPTRAALALAWSEALTAIPGQVSQDPATLQTYLSRPGKWQASLASGVVTFHPDAGGEPVQCRAEWVRTPDSILELNKELMPIFMQGWIDQRSGHSLEDCEFGEKTIGRKLWISGYEASKSNPIISYTEYINSIANE